MDKLVEEAIKIEATKLASKYQIGKINRIRDILKKTAIDFNGARLMGLKKTQYSLENGIFFNPSLDEALDLLPSNTAIELFENNDPDELIIKTTAIQYLFSKDTPFYTHRELAKLINKFINYFEDDDNKESLILIGYPVKKFTASYWLHNKLSRLYPVKIPSSKAYSEKEDKKDSNGNIIILYSWQKEKEKPFISGICTPCNYDEAPFIEGLSYKDIGKIENDREKLLNLKIQILKILVEDINSQKSTKLWDKCISVINDNLSINEFKYYLDELEKKYLDLFIAIQFRDGSYIGRVNPYFGFNKDLDAGGIKNIIEVIHFAEKELKIKKMHNMKTKILPLIGDIEINSYYDLVKSIFPGDRFEIDNIILQFFKYTEEESKFDEYFNNRLKKDIENKFKVQILVKPQYFNIHLDYERYLESSSECGISQNISFLKSKPKTKSVTPLHLPPDTKWQDITLEFLDGHNVSIRIGKYNIKSDYKGMGFEDERRFEPNTQWNFLKILADYNGEISWEHQHANTKIKKTKQLLADALKAYFKITEDPFYPYRKEKSYRIKMKLIPEERNQI